jgi:hypothetical protein
MRTKLLPQGAGTVSEERRRGMRRGGIIGLVGVLGLVALLLAGSAGAFPPERPMAQGGAPTLISYQGRLTAPSTGDPKPDGNYSMTFRLFSTQSGGSSIWSETQMVSVSGGLFNVLLGSDTALSASVFSGTSRWLEVEVGGEMLSPRQRIVSVAYALQAQEAANADKVDGQHASAFAASGHNHDDAYLNDDREETIQAAVNDGILLTVKNTGAGSDVMGLYASGKDRGVNGYSDSGDGVHGGSLSGKAVSGLTLTGKGVEGHSTNGVGVYGISDYDIGVHARSNSSLPLKVDGAYGSNLIEAWDIVAFPGNLRFKVTTSGNVTADGTFTGGGADFAEMMATAQGVAYEPGDLLVIGADGKPLPSSVPNAANLLGVYSSDPGFVGGVGDDGDTRGKIPVAIAGIVPLKASVENGAILPGDLLTSSSVASHAMKASPVTINGITLYRPGTILGKSLEPLEEGRGVILVLVTLQ